MCKMSKVRVSNGSPTLERVDARLADHAKAPVCRNLFGSVDREEFDRDVQQQMLEMERASMKKWNFDFINSDPLAHGDYQWQEVDAREVPEFYSRPPHVKRDSSSGTVDHNGNHDYLLTAPSSLGSAERTEPAAHRDYSTALSTPRKRPSTEDQADEPCQSKRASALGSEEPRAPTTARSLERAHCDADPKT